ncbi:MAG: fumarylacetoacetase, partial [Verrucomicrobiota bacterium]|nr:fumarylacetoacetase [Verrucomicrobiota bacterium]
MPLRSFIDVAPGSHFPLENLPFGVFKPASGPARIGVAIGDQILDLSVVEEQGSFSDPVFEHERVFHYDSLNAFLSLGRPAWRKAREVIQRLLSADQPELRDNAAVRARAFHRQNEVTMQL